MILSNKAISCLIYNFIINVGYVFAQHGLEILMLLQNYCILFCCSFNSFVHRLLMPWNGWWLNSLPLSIKIDRGISKYTIQYLKIHAKEFIKVSSQNMHPLPGQIFKF